MSVSLSGRKVACRCRVYESVCENVYVLNSILLWGLIKPQTLKSGNGGGHMRKSRVLWEYSACVICKCGRHDTRQGTHYAAIIQAQGLNVTELYPFNRKQNLFPKARHNSSNTFSGCHKPKISLWSIDCPAFPELSFASCYSFWVFL